MFSKAHHWAQTDHHAPMICFACPTTEFFTNKRHIPFNWNWSRDRFQKEFQPRQNQNPEHEAQNFTKNNKLIDHCRTYIFQSYDVVTFHYFFPIKSLSNAIEQSW